MTTTTQRPEITDAMKQAAKNVFMAMAYTRTIRPIVEEYQKLVIAEIKPPVAEEWLSRGIASRLITDAKDTYLMEDKDFQTYLKRCNEERIKARLHVDNEEFCPLLVAEDLQRRAERVFIEAMIPITHLTPERVLCSENGLANYDKLIDLSLRLLAPYVK